MFWTRLHRRMQAPIMLLIILLNTTDGPPAPGMSVKLHSTFPYKTITNTQCNPVSLAGSNSHQNQAPKQNESQSPQTQCRDFKTRSLNQNPESPKLSMQIQRLKHELKPRFPKVRAVSIETNSCSWQTHLSQPLVKSPEAGIPCEEWWGNLANFADLLWPFLCYTLRLWIR